MQAGQFLERADKTTRILDVRYQTLPERGVPQTVSHDRCARMVGRPALVQRVGRLQDHSRRGSAVRGSSRNFCCSNEDFPRSVRFCVGELNHALRRISGVAEGNFCNDAEKLAGRLLRGTAVQHH